MKLDVCSFKLQQECVDKPENRIIEANKRLLYFKESYLMVWIHAMAGRYMRNLFGTYVHIPDEA